MKKFNYFFWLLFLILSFIGCEKNSSGIAKMHWDRDMCERCKMAISDRKFAVQIINPKTGKVYKFDDIGCAVLWLKEEKIPWANEAKIYVTDAKSGKWINAKSAKYADDLITPMAYGFGAYSKDTVPKDKKLYDFNYTKAKIFKIEILNNQKVGSQ